MNHDPRRSRTVSAALSSAMTLLCMLGCGHNAAAPRCTQVNREIGIEEPATGATLSDLLARTAGTYHVAATWTNPRAEPGTTLELIVTHDTSRPGRLNDQTPARAEVGAAECSDMLYAPVRIGFRTADGSFDEVGTTHVVAGLGPDGTSSEPSFVLDVQPEQLAGTFPHREPSGDPESVYYRIEIHFRDGAIHGHVRLHAFTLRSPSRRPGDERSWGSTDEILTWGD